MSRRGPAATPRHLRPYSTLSITRIQGNTLSRWKTIPRSRPGPSISLPSTTIAPDEGPTRPAIICRSVLLPQPEGPIRHTNSPSGTIGETSSTAFTRGRLRAYSCGRGERARSSGDWFQSGISPSRSRSREPPRRKACDRRGRQTIGENSGAAEREQRGQNPLWVGRSRKDFKHLAYPRLRAKQFRNGLEPPSACKRDSETAKDLRDRPGIRMSRNIRPRCAPRVSA